MALTERYCNPDLATGNNDGTSETHAWQDLQTALNGMVTLGAGSRLNLKQTSSRDTIASDLALSGWAATQGNPTHIRSYASTTGDGGVYECDLGANQFLISDCPYLVIEGVDFSGAANNHTYEWLTEVATQSNNMLFYNCKFRTWLSGAGASYSGAGVCARANTNFIGCYFSSANNSNGVRAIDVQDDKGAFLYGCYITTGRAGIESYGNTNLLLINSLVVGTGTGASVGLGESPSDDPGPLRDQSDHYNVLINNTFNDFAITFNVESGYTPGNYGCSLSINNIIYDSAIPLFNGEVNDPGMSIYLINNASGLTTSTWELGDQPTIGDITVVGDPFVDRSTNDYRLNNSAGGPLCIGSGINTDLNIDGTQDNYIDMGAIQTLAPTTTGTGKMALTQRLGVIG